jgi:hypothetical protein
MCAGSGSSGNGDGPSIGTVISNWSDYDASFATKLRMAARNIWRRVVLRHNCCGNHGQPGC